jgi:outer membrane protein TolC
MKRQILGLLLLGLAGCWPDDFLMPQSSGPPPCEAAPLAPGVPLTLPTALELAGVNNPTIALAQEAVRTSEAELLQARAELLPDLNVGGSFNWHRGNIQSSRGVIEDINRQSAYLGAGAFAVGTGTVGVPGIGLNVHLAEAWFDPQIARAAVAGRQFDATAVRNTTLLDVAVRFYTLAAAQARLDAVHQSETDLGVLVKLTTAQADAGQGRRADAERAQTEADLLHAVGQHTHEEVGVAAAELARLLSVDPALELRAAAPLMVLQLVDPNLSLQALIDMALRNRPELGARSADVAAAEKLLRKEQVRPLVPKVYIGLSSGEFGGGGTGAPSSFGQNGNRVDFDVVAAWSLEHLGVGNLTKERARRAEVLEAVAERSRAVNTIRREVADALTDSAARFQEIQLARQRVQTATLAFDRDVIAVRNLPDNRQGRPIVALDSAKLLTEARQALVRAEAGYTIAQFQLYVALGQPPVAK